MRFGIISAVTAMVVIAAGVADAAPRVRTVTLQRLTTLTVDLVPDLGVRFTFPFILDEHDDYVPFTMTSTNPVFVPERKDGRNSFVVVVDPQKIAAAPARAGERLPTYYGNLFVTVAGYEVSVELRTTAQLADHYTDVVFELGEDDREILIQKLAAQRTKALEAEYQKRAAEIDHLAEQRAMARVGVLALRTPKTTRIKEEATTKLTSGETLTLYVDRAVTYDPYTIVVFDLENHSRGQGVTVLDAKLVAVDPATKAERPIESAKDVEGRVLPDSTVRGVITVLGMRLESHEVLRLDVVTDQGIVQAQW